MSERVDVMSKKVLHILATSKFSGAENVVCQIIKTFENDSKYEMAYCSPDGDIAKILEQKNIKHIPIKKLNYSNLRKVVDEYKPDIIHGHDFRCSIFAGLLKKKEQSISHLHCNPDFIKKWSIKSILYNLIKRKFDDIIVVSKEVKEEAVFLKNCSKVTIINNCINKDDVLNKFEKYEVKEKYDIVCIGRLTAAKNNKKIIDVIEKIVEKRPETKAVFIGDGADREIVEAYIKEKNLENVIELKGFLENPFPYLKNAKVSIMPSKYEGFGLSAIECMICGVPVLNSGAGGLKTIFENDKYYICDETEEYAEKALEIILNDKKYDFESILNRYTNMEEWKKSFEEVYR